MPRIFISYRREESGGHAGRLADSLRRRMHPRDLFIDVEQLRAGVDFAEAIRSAVDRSAVVIALIGRDWTTCTTSDGRRCLDDPNDYVRLEIASALARERVLVVPVLVQAAPPPAERAPPPDLKPLAGRQAIALDDSSWSS